MIWNRWIFSDDIKLTIQSIFPALSAVAMDINSDHGQDAKRGDMMVSDIKSCARFRVLWKGHFLIESPNILH